MGHKAEPAQVSEPGFFERHSHATRAAILVIFSVSSVLVGEGVLRLSGVAPGQTFYREVDELSVSLEFYTDERGIFKASTTVPINYWGERVQVNRDGFRGPDFAPPEPGQESILLLGDSFAFGGTAVPLSTSFADRVAQAGYRVYNTGIPAVGVRQYEALAELYIPRFEPDHVIVSLYMGNDLRRRAEFTLPGHNLYHVTNAGWLQGYDEDGNPLTAQEAYATFVGNRFRLRRFAYATAFGTAVWHAARTLSDGEIAHRIGALLGDRDLPAEFSQTFDRLRRIRALAEASGARFHLLVIPNHGRNCSRYETRVEHYRSVFDSLAPIYLDDIPKETYFPLPECHMNSRGHGFVADRILGAIR